MREFVLWQAIHFQGLYGYSHKTLCNADISCIHDCLAFGCAQSHSNRSFHPPFQTVHLFFHNSTLQISCKWQIYSNWFADSNLSIIARPCFGEVQSPTALPDSSARGQNFASTCTICNQVFATPCGFIDPRCIHLQKTVSLTCGLTVRSSAIHQQVSTCAVRWSLQAYAFSDW